MKDEKTTLLVKIGNKSSHIYNYAYSPIVFQTQTVWIWLWNNMKTSTLISLNQSNETATTKNTEWSDIQNVANKNGRLQCLWPIFTAILHVPKWLRRRTCSYWIFIEWFTTQWKRANLAGEKNESINNFKHNLCTLSHGKSFYDVYNCLVDLSHAHLPFEICKNIDNYRIQRVMCSWRYFLLAPRSKT